jgi:hypothetical protein
MKNLSVKLEDSKFKIYDKDDLFGEIIFDKNSTAASLLLKDKKLRTEKDSDNNMVLKDDQNDLFTLKFDYIWGGAEIIANKLDTGFDIKGRWFKPGTRLINQDDNDLIIAVKKGNGLEVSVLDERVSDVMIIATIYFHLYTSASKLLAILYT